MVAHHGECAQCHWTVHFKMVKMVNSVMYILQQSKKKTFLESVFIVIYAEEKHLLGFWPGLQYLSLGENRCFHIRVFQSMEMAIPLSSLTFSIILYYLVYKSCHLTLFFCVCIFLSLNNLNTWNPTHVGTRRNFKNHLAITFLPPFPDW